MMRKGLFAFSFVLVLSGCGGGSPVDDDEAIHKLMLEELDPTIDGIWENQGWERTEAGETSLFPSTEEGWDEVLASADRVAEIADQLAGPEFAKGRRDWVELSHALREAVLHAKSMAEARDEQAFFDAGGAIYQVCLRCHERYALPDEEE